MKQYKLDDYIADVKKSLQENNTELTTHKGEMRRGHQWDILAGTLSSRHYIKVLNVKTQNMLEQRLEPLYSMLEAAGCQGVYSRDHFRYAWKKLIQNHPHDTICGCSRDEVHAHSEDNYKRIGEFNRTMLERGLTELVYHSDAARLHDGTAYIINVVNTTANEQSGAVEVQVDFLRSEAVKNFRIEDLNGTPVSFGIISRQEAKRDVFSPLNLPGVLDVDRFTIWMDAGAVAPYSCKGFKIIPVETECEFIANASAAVIENEFLKVSVSETGRVDLVRKADGVVYEDMLYVEDMADRGDSYIYGNAGDVPVTSKEFVPKIEVLENNNFSGKIRITWDMQLPAFYDFEKRERSQERGLVRVSLTLKLEKGAPMLKVDYETDNYCGDHRLRIVADTGMKDAKCYADMPFDITERKDCFYEVHPTTQTFPNTSFAALEEGGRGVAVLTEGAHEAENIRNGRMAFTVLRATAVISRSESLENTNGDIWIVPGNQCMRRMSGSLAIVAYSGGYVEGDIPNQAINFRTPLCARSYAVDRRRFSGGRPAVQDTKTGGIYYLPDYWPEADAGNNASAFGVKGEGIAVSAVKKAERCDGQIIRFYNFSDCAQKAEIAAKGKISRTDMAEKSRELLGEDHIEMEVGAKEIVTLYIER